VPDHRNADRQHQHIDYCLNILGIRVLEKACRLIAKGNGEWSPIGPLWDLPLEIPRDETELRNAGIDALRVTAWQYEREHPGTDIRDVLSQTIPFGTALDRHY
jgi:hypothetical protein